MFIFHDDAILHRWFITEKRAITNYGKRWDFVCYEEGQKFAKINGISLTLSQTTILDPSKLKEFAADNFKFDENGRKFCKRVENIVGKGEIAHYEQFLLCPQCFQNTCTADM